MRPWFQAAGFTLTGVVEVVWNEKGWRELSRLRRAVFRAEQALAEIDRTLLLPDGLCTSDLSILERLAKKGMAPVNGLGRRIGLTSGSMTVAVQRLRRRGLVETRRDLKDKRVVWVSATQEGKALVKRLARVRGEAYGEIFSDWSDRERSLLTTLLKRLRKASARDVREMGSRTR